MVKDWIANTYEGMSRRQFLARMSAAGIGLTGFAIAATPGYYHPHRRSHRG